MVKNWADRTPLTQQQAKEIADILGIHDDPKVSLEYRGMGPANNPFYQMISPAHITTLRERNLWELLIHSDLYSNNPLGGGHQIESRRLNSIANNQISELGV